MRLRHVLRAHAEAVLDEVEGAVAHIATDALSDPLRRRIVAKRDRYEHALRGLVGECLVDRESGSRERNRWRAGASGPAVVHANGDVAVVTRAMLGALNWTATWFRPDGERSAGAVADTIANYLMAGMKNLNATKETA